MYICSRPFLWLTCLVQKITWYRGREARQRSAKPFTAVRICSVPQQQARSREKAQATRWYTFLLVPCSICTVFLLSRALFHLSLAPCILCLLYALFKHHRHPCLFTHHRFVFHAVDLSPRPPEIFYWFLFGAKHVWTPWQIVFNFCHHIHSFIFNTKSVGEAHELADCSTYNRLFREDLFSFHFLLQWDLSN